MSLSCGVPIIESVYCLACARWVWKRCLYNAAHESENWGLATSEEFEPVPRVCRYILSAYEEDIRNPIWAPPGGYRMNPNWIILRKDYEETHGRSTPYLIYLDHDNADVVVAFRGLNLGSQSDYAVLLDNKLGQTAFDGGYVHNGLLKAARWVFDTEHEVLRELLERHPTYKLTLAGHSLGAGVAALLTMVVLQNRHVLGNIERKRMRCYSIAPTRSISLNLAVRYADVINSIVLQDDFLPRTTAALEDVYKSLLCLPCVLCIMCLTDTCMLEEQRLKDPRRLYAPGRLYHIVERKPWRIGRFPPVVRTAVPVDGRFEDMILSCNATQDHAIIWILREAQVALDLMVERDKTMEIPAAQRMEREHVLSREHNQEHKAALERAAALDVSRTQSYPHSYGTFNKMEETGMLVSRSPGEAAASSCSSSKRWKDSWGELIKRLFDTDESGHMVLKSPQTPKT
ncbi:hypothetical protein Dimus_006532 [Dionaea muscipula]